MGSNTNSVRETEADEPSRGSGIFQQKNIRDEGGRDTAEAEPSTLLVLGGAEAGSWRNSLITLCKKSSSKVYN